MLEFKGTETAADAAEMISDVLKVDRARIDELEQKMARGVGAGSFNDPYAAKLGRPDCGQA